MSRPPRGRAVPAPPLTPDQLRKLAGLIYDDELELVPETSEPGQVRALPRIPPAAVMNRLDQVVGPAGWTWDWSPAPGGVIGRLAVAGVLRVGVAATPDEALVECARQLGVGSYLARLPELRGEWDGERWTPRPRWKTRDVDQALEAAEANYIRV